MKYLYTTEPDEGCHKIDGVYGRPVHTYEQKALKAKGWKETANELREEGREEAEEVSESMDYDEYLRQKYKEVFGKKPHHKLKRETMIEKIEDAHSEILSGDV